MSSEILLEDFELTERTRLWSVDLVFILCMTVNLHLLSRTFGSADSFSCFTILLEIWSLGLFEEYGFTAFQTEDK